MFDFRDEALYNDKGLLFTHLTIAPGQPKGENMAKNICPNCKTENDPKNVFCQSCGTSLVAAPVTPPPAPVSTPPPAPVVPPPARAAAVPPPPVQAVPPPPAYGQPPAYGYPPAPMYYMGTPIKQLGTHTDGWSDVIEDGAPLADKVKAAFIEKMNVEKIPGLRITEANISNGQMENRPYQLVSGPLGMTVAVRIAPYGKNLAISWDLFTKREANWLTIGLLGGIVFVLAVLDTVSYSLSFYYDIFYAIFSFLGTFIGWLLVPSLVLVLLGKIIKDDWIGLFVKDPNPFAVDDAISLTTVVDNALADAVETAATAPEPKPTPKPAAKPAPAKANAKK
jgi:hypothetical protein